MQNVMKNGFDIISMRSPAGKVELSLAPERGNIISSLKYCGQELIYLDMTNFQSDERPRCGCPVLFPFSGNNKNENLIINGEHYPTGIHGVVHTNRWRIEKFSSINCCTAELSTEATQESRKSYPFDFQLYTQIEVDDCGFSYEITAFNHSQDDMPCDFGLHPFFSISGLKHLRFKLGSNEQVSEDDLDEMRTSGRMYRRCKYVTFQNEENNISITVKNETAYQNMLLWSGNEKKFLVVEPLTAQPNAINEGRNYFTIKPGRSAVAKVRVEISNCK